MPGSGTHNFLDPDHYEASLRRAQIELIITCGGDFKARLTWVELHHLQLIRCEEDLRRIGYVSFPSQLACISFPTNSGLLPVWRGAELQAQDILFHRRSDRLHQVTSGPSIWSVIALDPVQLQEYGRALFGKRISWPVEGRVLRPSARDAARLRRLHAQTSRMAETKPKNLSHPEVARAIEQDLIYALVTCLTGARVQEEGAGKRHHALIMSRFEEVLTEYLNRPLSMPDLCELTGVAGRTLGWCCREFLGISPSRYMLRRRLMQVRGALRNADPDIVNVTEVARRYGFTQLGRFAGVYRAVFGESPSTTLKRVPGIRFSSP